MVRALWRERWRRPGWAISTTPLGGRIARGYAPDLHRALGDLSDEQRLKVDRLTSQVFIAHNWEDDASAPTSDVAFFAHVATKIFQRGANPSVHGLQSKTVGVTAEELLAAAVGPLMGPCVLDESFALDDTYETKVWDLVQDQHPSLVRFFVPQPSLDELANTQANGDRWCDFGLFAPWLDKPVILEVDGQQHGPMQGVDEQRDEILTKARYRVRRFTGAEIAAGASALSGALSWTADCKPSNPHPDLVRDLHLPALVSRLGVAFVQFLRDGRLTSGGEWKIDIEDSSGWSRETIELALNLLDAIDRVWSLNLMPATLRTNLGTWHRTDFGYSAIAHDALVDFTPQVRFVYEPFAAPWHVLPQSTLPTIVMRNSYVPTDISWLPLEPTDRRQLDAGSPHVGGSLARTMRHLFGFHEFREGQCEAVACALAGIDACVLLPTGAGKSLIYQLAGLLQPGMTLTIDPLVSLIDDQAMRLRQDGIDRMIAIHGRDTRDQEHSNRLHTELASGEHFFAFLTPERLQIQRFRDALAGAAKIHPVTLAVIDEAHCVSEWGHDFRTAYLRVGRNVRELGRGDSPFPPSLLALTGTASPGVLRDLQNELSGDRPLEVVRPRTFDRSNLHYEVVLASESTRNAQLRAALVNTIPEALGISSTDMTRPDGTATNSGIVFVPHVNGSLGVDAIRREVKAAFAHGLQGGDGVGVGVEVYSGKPPTNHPQARDWDRIKVKAAQAFKENDSPVLVSTKAFGMGIDKPNIRWTLHVGFPSSLEGFAQEAGRAGRDGSESHCVLVTSPAPPELVQELLDHTITHDERKAAFDRLPRSVDSDLKRQYFFLTKSYEGVDAELKDALEIVQQLMAHAPGSEVLIPKPFGKDSAQKVLYRLATLGVVEDYTVEGSSGFSIHLANFDGPSIDAALKRFVTRVAPGQVSERLSSLRSAPTAMEPRVLHHLRVLLELLYDVVEPARVRALAEMNTFATSGDDDAGLRSRLLSYLSDGPAAGLMHEIATSPSVDVQKMAEDLKVLPAADPYEWLGAAARQLESYPDHPALLIIRGASEAMLEHPDASIIDSSFSLAFNSTGKYGMNDAEVERLFRWTLTQLRSQLDGAGRGATPRLFRSWLEAGLSETVIEVEEQAILDDAVSGDANPSELSFVLTRRLTRAADSAQVFNRVTSKVKAP